MPLYQLESFQSSIEYFKFRLFYTLDTGMYMICFIINQVNYLKESLEFWKQIDALENCLAFQCQETYARQVSLEKESWKPLGF